VDISSLWQAEARAEETKDFVREEANAPLILNSPLKRKSALCSKDSEVTLLRDISQTKGICRGTHYAWLKAEVSSLNSLFL
jgi:hypothetical protein